MYTSNISEKVIETLLEKASNDGVQKIVVGAVIKRNGKNLVLRRTPDEFMGGLVELPSGNVDTGENLLDALAREVKEETNLEVSIVEKYVSCFDYISGSGKKARQFNFITTILDNEIKLNPSEHDGFFWINSTDVDMSILNISKHTKEVLMLSNG